MYDLSIMILQIKSVRNNFEYSNSVKKRTKFELRLILHNSRIPSLGRKEKQERTRP